MNEAKLYEKLGRQAAEIENRAEQYQELLVLLARVVKGDIHRSRVLVNLTDSTWSFCEEGQTPAMPSQINGYPIVVVSPPEETKVEAA